jgi:hypothetical protein
MIELSARQQISSMRDIRAKEFSPSASDGAVPADSDEPSMRRVRTRKAM